VDRIANIPFLEPAYKARALAFRAIEGCRWLLHTVEEVNGEAASDATRQKSLELSEEAVHLHEKCTTENGFAHYVRFVVKRSLGLLHHESWDKVCSRPNLDRDDLYFSFLCLAEHVVKAGHSGDVNHMRLCISAAQETLNLGEWGKMFDTWWKLQEQGLGNSELWRKACQQEALVVQLRPARWKEVTSHLSTPPRESHPYASSTTSTEIQQKPWCEATAPRQHWSGIIAQQVTQAVVEEVVTDSTLLMTNAVDSFFNSM
jgi:hypothetical protein